MPLSNITLKTYNKLYNKTKKLLVKQLVPPYLDHHEIIQQVLELYFTLKEQSPLDSCLETVLTKMKTDYSIPETIESFSDAVFDDLSYVEVENTIDLYRLYCSIEDHLTLDERHLFTLLISGNNLEEISNTLKLTEDQLLQLKENLIRKLRYALTSTEEEIHSGKQRKRFVYN